MVVALNCKLTKLLLEKTNEYIALQQQYHQKDIYKLDNDARKDWEKPSSTQCSNSNFNFTPNNDE